MGAAKKNINIEKIIKETAKETVKELEKARLIKNDEITYFQKIEKLLYSYPDLLKAVEQKEKDIEFIQEHGLQGKSKSIVFFSTNRSNGGPDKYVEILESYKDSKARTERLISKIKRALDEIKEDQYYCIVEAKYFEKLSNSEIEKKHNISESTIRRHKNRLVNKLKVLLFGADALE